MSEARFPGRILRRFVEAAGSELGADQFTAMLALSDLPDPGSPQVRAGPRR